MTAKDFLATEPWKNKEHHKLLFGLDLECESELFCSTALYCDGGDAVASLEKLHPGASELEAAIFATELELEEWIYEKK